MKKLISPTNYTDSWHLAKESFHFLSENKDLNFFPLLSLLSILMVLICATDLFPNKDALMHDFKAYGLLVLLYILLSFVLIYLKAAFTAVVLKRLNKERASLTDGFHKANQRFASILKWSMLTSTLGLFGKIAEAPQDLVEKLLGYSVGFTWSTASYFVLPMLIVENVGPLKAMQRSVKVVGYGWKNTVSVKALVTIFFVFVLLLMSEFIGHPNEMISITLFVAPVFLILYLIGAVLESTIISALFINVVQQKNPQHFDTSILGRAFIKEED